MTISELNDLLKTRRSIFPKSYIQGKDIPESDILQILENANFAPSHRLTEPWRFKILRGAAKQRLADFMVEDYLAMTPIEAQSEVKMQKMAENPTRSAVAIALVLKRHEELLPEWEEIASLAMAVQNMWLTCSILGIGCYWSSPTAITLRGQDFLKLAADERCLGLFYMGYHNVSMADLPAVRKPIAEKITWLND